MIGIVDLGGANLTSLTNAFDRLGIQCVVSTEKTILNQATHLVLPGVGHAKVSEEKLNTTELISYLKKDQRPILGICLGFQILYSTLEEGTTNSINTLGLDVLPGHVKKLQPTSNFTVPHMGWSKLDIITENTKLLYRIPADAQFYFVHSYVTPMNEHVTSLALNDIQIPATLEYKNFYATQFHPEKSGLVGESVLKNFLKI